MLKRQLCLVNHCTNKIMISKMLVLLLTFAVLLGTGFGQSSDTARPTLKEVHSSQEALASQLRDVLAKYNRQQSSESLTNIMQLLLVKQLMAEMYLNTLAAGEGTTSGSHCECKPVNTTIAGIDLTGVIEAMNATINRLIVQDLENRQAIYNLTAIFKESRQVTHTLATAIQDNRHGINNLTTVLQQLQTTRNLSTAVEDNRHAIRNLTTLVQVKGKTQATYNLSQAVRNNEEWLHSLTSSVQENRQAIHNLTQNSRLFYSCGEIKTARPWSTSGNYTVLDPGNNLRQVYCHMEEFCGRSGWMKVGHLNMTDPSQQCPRGFRLYNESGVRACGSPTLASGCRVYVSFIALVKFTEVCGRVTGYQYWSPDAFNVGSSYVDGVLLTAGSKHIWSFAAARQENSTSCPCSGSTESTNAFVGNDYFCESGNSGSSVQQRLYPEPLWDGQGCRGSEAPCCNATGIPWFHKRLSQSGPNAFVVTMRICSNRHDADTPIGYYEIYVN